MLVALAKRLGAGSKETVEEYQKALRSYGKYEDFRVACEDREELFYAVLDKTGDDGIDPITLNNAMRGVSYSIDYDGVYHAKGLPEQIRAAEKVITMLFAKEWLRMTDEEKNEICAAADLDREQTEKAMSPDVLSKLKIGSSRPFKQAKPVMRKIRAWP